MGDVQSDNWDWAEVAPKFKPAKTPAGRKADERKRHKDAGRVAVTVYVRPEFRDDVRALEAKLQRRETQRNPAPISAAVSR
jgi:hypothetical protein